MQEEVTQKTISLVIKTAKLDANVLKAAMRMYLSNPGLITPPVRTTETVLPV